MKYTHEKNRIYAQNANGDVIAEVDFPNEGDTFTINHTFVADSLRGQGVASELVNLAVNQIESNGGKVKATCSYAVSWLEKQKGK